MKTNLRFSSTNPSILPEDIREFERKTKITLPDDYKAFLLDVNGGQVAEYQEIILQDGSEYGISLVFDYMYGIKVSDSYYDLMSLFFSLREGESIDILPEHILEIMDCRDGHYRIVLSTAPDDYGYVYMWDNQAPFDYSEARLIAKSFTEFLDMVGEVDQNERLARYYRLRDRSKGKSNEE